MLLIYPLLRRFGGLFVIAPLVLSTACQTQVKPQVSQGSVARVADEQMPQTGSPAQASASDPVEDAPQPTPKPHPLAEIEKKLLREAERAFRAKDYTTPTYNNAYDKFQSVLLINPQSDQARAGLQAILLRYTALTRDALAKGRLSSAERHLRQVELYYPANSLLIDLKKQVAQERQRIAASQRLRQQEPPDLDAEEIPLWPADLNDKSPELMDLLAGVAKRLRESEESVMIFARSDKEGRWIYQQLKRSAEGYRVRGDIRIANKPKLQILPPL